MKILYPTAFALIVVLVGKPSFTSPAFSDDIFSTYYDSEELPHADLPNRNKDDISDLYNFINNKVVPEIKKNLQNDETNARNTSLNIAAVKKYMDQKIEDSIGNVEETLAKMYANINKNIEEIIKKNEENYSHLESKTLKNFEMVARKLSEEKSATIENLESRLKQHEDLYDTHLAICGEQFSHLGTGRVNFDISMESVSIKGRPMRGTNVLLPGGQFLVPKGGDGIYKISLSLILDTVHDRSSRTSSAKFVFESVQSGRTMLHKETQLVSNAGRPDKDKVPASRSILFDLKAGDQVAVKQLNKHAESTFTLTLCIHLVKPSQPSDWISLSKTATRPALLTDETYQKPELEDFKVDTLLADVEEPTIQPALSEALTVPTPQLPSFFTTPPLEITTEHGSGVHVPDLFD